MTRQRFSKTKINYLVMAGAVALMLLISACSAGAPASEPVRVAEAPAREEAAEVIEAAEPEVEPVVAPQSAAEDESAAGSPATNRPNVYNRLIIKNAEVQLTVESADTAINRSLGIVTEYGGYVVSNRTWFSDDGKHATLTIGVPAENFEEMLRRLKELAVEVTNETVSGQDVTDEFVDLESRLRNLEATADRIRTFLEQAQTVEESLKVSNQLAAIEAEIEQVKGRMAYLKDRAAFSTITLQFSPQVVVPTPTPSPTPSPTPTPVVWSASNTLDKATTVTSHTAQALFQTGVDLLIWFVVVILPFTLPFVVVFWIGLRLARRLAANVNVRPPSS